LHSQAENALAVEINRTSQPALLIDLRPFPGP
jgi:hypothetical protein